MTTNSMQNLFFPQEIALPRCALLLLEFIYPTVDWSRVRFHMGFPHIFNAAGGKDGVTVPAAFSANRINVYIKPSAWDPCSCRGLGLIVHEGFHVLQIQSVLHGYGVGLVRPATISYLSCYVVEWISAWSRKEAYENNPAELAAYKVAGRASSLFNTCCKLLVDGAPSLPDGTKTDVMPCNCTCQPPSVNQVGLQLFQHNCAGVVQQSPGIGFWESFAECIPGLEKIADAARWFWRKLCPDRSAGLALWFSCGIAAIGAGLLWATYGLYYGLWLLLFTVVAVVCAFVVAFVELVGGVVAVGEAIWNALSSLSTSSKGRTWSTTFDGMAWKLPDVPVTKDDHTRTSSAPSLAVYNGQLYMAYRAASSSEIWYNVFDGTNWLARDIGISQGDRTRTSRSPSLAVYNGKLYMAYRAASSSEIWYNVFDGTNWLAQDIGISQGDRTRTSRSPSLAVYNGKLYMAYRAASANDLTSDIWYNVFDGADWLAQDIRISQGDRTRTSDAPSLAVYNGQLYMAYRAASSSDIWYNVFDGANWLAQDIRISRDGHTRTSAAPSLAVYNGQLYMAYRGAGSSDIWYNKFDGTRWRDEDCRVSDDDHVKTGRGPSIADFANLLYLVYRDDS